MSEEKFVWVQWKLFKGMKYLLACNGALNIDCETKVDTHAGESHGLDGFGVRGGL